MNSILKYLTLTSASLGASAQAADQWWILNANTFECSTIDRSPHEVAAHPDCTMTGNNVQLGAYEVTCDAAPGRPKAWLIFTETKKGCENISTLMKLPDSTWEK